MAATNLTHKRLLELIFYDPATGLFERLATRGSGPALGQIKNQLHHKGYLYLRVDNDRFVAQRLAFFYMKGEWPTIAIDHINGIRDDNRWTNLREAHNNINPQNLKVAHKTSTTGLLGVTVQKARSPRETETYRAEIGVDTRRINLGTYATPMEAHLAYLQAKRILHPGNTL